VGLRWQWIWVVQWVDGWLGGTMALTVSRTMSDVVSAAALHFPPIARSNFRCKNRARLFVARAAAVQGKLRQLCNAEVLQNPNGNRANMFKLLLQVEPTYVWPKGGGCSGAQAKQINVQHFCQK